MPASELFIPRNHGSQPSKQPAAFVPRLSLSTTGNVASGNATPIPEAPFSCSPAWDPNSHLPQECAHEQSNPVTGPSHLPIPFSTNHILLDSRLLGAQLRVIVTGGLYDHKELTATIEARGESLIMLYKAYTTATPLAPEWVTPMYPNPTRDNGLLVVIQGDHCGKYVRRVHHRYEGEKPIVILGVVSRLAGHADTLTEERLELEVSDLCLCKESKEDKRQNKSLMDAVREEARKIRAK